MRGAFRRPGSDFFTRPGDKYKLQRYGVCRSRANWAAVREVIAPRMS